MALLRKILLCAGIGGFTVATLSGGTSAGCGKAEVLEELSTLSGGGSNTQETEKQSLQDPTSYRPTSLPQVVTDPSFIVLATLTAEEEKAVITGTLADNTTGTAAANRIVVAVLARRGADGKFFDVAETRVTTDASGQFVAELPGATPEDFIYIAAEESNTLILSVEKDAAPAAGGGAGGTVQEATPGEATDTTPPTLQSVSAFLKNAATPTFTALQAGVRVSSALALKFSEAMAGSSLGANTGQTTATSPVRLACDAANVGSSVTRILTDTDTVSDNEWSLTPVGNLPALADCSLTVAGGTGGAADTAGNPLTADSTTNLSTGCTSTETFSKRAAVDQQVCWSQFNHTLAGTYATDTTTGTFGFVSGQTALSTDPAVATASGFYKLSSDDNVTVVLKVDAMSGGDFGDGLRLFIADSDSNVPALLSNQFYVDWRMDGTVSRRCNAATVDANGAATVNGFNTSFQLCGAPVQGNQTPLYLRIVKSGTTFSAAAGTDGTNFTTIAENISVAAITSPFAVGVLFTTRVDLTTFGGTPLRATLDSLTFVTGGATGQD